MDPIKSEPPVASSPFKKLSVLLAIVTAFVLGFATGIIPLDSKEQGVQESTRSTSSVDDSVAAYVPAKDMVASSLEYFECPGAKDMAAAFSKNRYSVTILIDDARVRALDEWGGEHPYPTQAKRYQSIVDGGISPADFIIDFYPDKAVILRDSSAGIAPEDSAGNSTAVTCARAER